MEIKNVQFFTLFVILHYITLYMEVFLEKVAYIAQNIMMELHLLSYIEFIKKAVI